MVDSNHELRGRPARSAPPVFPPDKLEDLITIQHPHKAEPCRLRAGRQAQAWAWYSVTGENPNRCEFVFASSPSAAARLEKAAGDASKIGEGPEFTLIQYWLPDGKSGMLVFPPGS